MSPEATHGGPITILVIGLWKHGSGPRFARADESLELPDESAHECFAVANRSSSYAPFESVPICASRRRIH